MESRTEHLITVIRKQPFFRQLVPQEAGIGWPMPMRQAGKVYIKLPFFGYASTTEQGKTALFPPFAMITVDWSHGLLVEYVTFRFRPPTLDLKWEGQVGTFPHPAVAHMTRSQYEERKSKLLSMYDTLFDTLTHGAVLAVSWENQFAQLLGTLMEPPFVPHYRAMAPKFFDRFLHVMEPLAHPTSE